MKATPRVSDNASPIVFLAKLERFEILRLGVDHVLVPLKVLGEIQAKSDAASAAAKRWLGDWLEECSLPEGEALPPLPDLGGGERDVIAQALRRRITSVALDDLDARKVARRFGLEPIGTVGLLLAAKKQGVDLSLKAELGRLRSFGFRVSSALGDRSPA